MELTIIHSKDLPWETGGRSLEIQPDAWRDNLGGTQEEIDSLFQHRRFRTFFADPQTGRRTTLSELTGGYEDLTNAYHDCVEETLVLSGALSLTGHPGDLTSGHYFWRPPGYVHKAIVTGFYRGLNFLEAERPDDDSGPVTRVIRPDEEVGMNPLHDDPETAVGPRGFVQNLNSHLLPWIPGTSFARSEDVLDGEDLEHIEVKVLSKNWVVGAQTLMVRVKPGYEQKRPSVAYRSEQQIFVLEGELSINGELCGAESYVRRLADARSGPMSSPSGAVFIQKSDGWLGFVD